MTQEEKDLLLKDLCARLPYGVMFDYNNNEPLKVEGIVRNVVYYKGYNYQTAGDECYASITECKPYLRPMSSMTWEEKKEFSIFGFEVIDHINANREGCPKYQVIEVSNFSGITEITDWLNAHHFDYRGLIEKGLAIEAPEDMYKI